MENETYWLITLAYKSKMDNRLIYESRATDNPPEYFIADYYGEGAKEEGKYWGVPHIINQTKITKDMYEHLEDIQV